MDDAAARAPPRAPRRSASRSASASSTRNRPSSRCDRRASSPSTSSITSAGTPVRAVLEAVDAARCSDGSARRGPALPARSGRGGPRRWRRLGEHLERDVAFQPVMSVAAIHLAHPAFAELGGDLIGTDARKPEAIGRAVGDYSGGVSLLSAMHTAYCSTAYLECNATARYAAFAISAGSNAAASTSSTAPTMRNRMRSRTSAGTSSRSCCVALRHDHLGQPGRMRGQDFLFQAADRQHAPLQRDFAGHPDRALHRPAASAATRSPSPS